MKTSEQDITKLLAVLRDAQPTQGFEQRILRAVEHRAATPSTFSWKPWVWSLATASLILAIAIAHHTQPVQPTTTIATTPPPQAITAPSQIITAPRTPSRPHVTTAPATTPLSASDQRALDNINAPSHPSSQLPLSQDERLFIAATRRGQAIEVAQLEPPPRVHAPREDPTQRIVQRFLHQLAAAESVNPTPPEPSTQIASNTNP